MDGSRMAHRRFLLALALVVGLSPAAQADVTMTIFNAGRYGPHLTDEGKHEYYLFTADQQGTSTQLPVSNCYDACAEVWPPVIADDGVKTDGPVDRSLIGRMERRDGSVQLTFNGWPLYRYVKKTGGGGAQTGRESELSGHGKQEFGGTWYLVSPEGMPVSEQ
ncbi:COG4315 family predicted lipoprotein [Rhodoligotrophos defluvii]|uniref:COG4315 family predicted lipoprotein n=1 Tax=Rhodoligotrophos defluvii TaxID=2561934 RepID=UPI0010C9AA02|nr:hypothetical protein [Rhodoligotrophos defluvii]